MNSNADDIMDFSKLLSDIKPKSDIDIDELKDNTETEENKPKRGRPKKAQVIEGPSIRNKNPLNSDMAYAETYQTPANMVANTIGQLEQLGSQIHDDLQAVRNSRTLKNKYLYITNLSGSLTGILSSKISAIKELRGMITDANNFELKKMNQLKINEKDSDDKIIMDMYNAYLNAPVGNLGSRSIANTPASYINSNNGIPISTQNGISYAEQSDSGYAQYMNSLTPEQKSMVSEKNPYIETVLVYNQSDQSKWFEVIDTRTGLPVEGIPVPPDFVRDGCSVNVRAGIARNSALNQTFKLKIVGVAQSNEF